MKITDIGSYRLDNEYGISVELENNSLIGFTGITASLVSESKSGSQFDEVTLFRILDDSVEFVQNGKALPIHCGQTVHFNGERWKLTFVCDENKIEDVITSFMENDLMGEYDIEQLFIQYAKKKKFSEKEVLYKIIATIDVPEIDKI